MAFSDKESTTQGAEAGRLSAPFSRLGDGASLPPLAGSTEDSEGGFCQFEPFPCSATLPFVQCFLLPPPIGPLTRIVSYKISHKIFQDQPPSCPVLPTPRRACVHPCRPPFPGLLLQGSPFSSGLVYKYRNLYLWPVCCEASMSGYFCITEEVLVGLCRLIFRTAESSRVSVSTGRWNFTQSGSQPCSDMFCGGWLKMC